MHSRRSHQATSSPSRLAVALLVLAAALVQADPPRECRDCATCPVLLEVPAGTFERRETLDGSTFPRRFERLYTIGKYAVTRAEFAAFVQATSYDTSGCTLWRTFGSKPDAQASWHTPGLEQAQDEPVVGVSWHEAQAYVDWLARQTGHSYRLPSEAEWEYAARAGAVADSTYWLRAGLKAGGANCADCDGIGTMGREELLSTKAMGTYAPNAFGLYDRMGNVAQWVADCATISLAEALQDGLAWLAGACTQCLTRGGSWHSNWSELASVREGCPSRSTPQ